MLHQEDEGLATSASSGRSPNSVDELIAVLGRIVLNDPVNIGDIDTPGSQIGCQQNLMHALLIIRLPLKFIVDLTSLFLINLAM